MNTEELEMQVRALRARAIFMEKAAVRELRALDERVRALEAGAAAGAGEGAGRPELPWVSVEEALPPEWEDVLCWTDTEDIEKLQRTDWCPKWQWTDFVRPAFGAHEVTHWCPLPKGPARAGAD